EDVKNFRVIYHLVKERGYTLQGAQQKIKESKGKTFNEVEVVDRLNKVRDFLISLRDGLPESQS
ncbi:MAG: MerR family transcriptional regulator, partial [Bacteroidetes bacterium]|nr:MerR family transcriptional regulator [Bacteroidota bacterium]